MKTVDFQYAENGVSVDFFYAPRGTPAGEYVPSDDVRRLLARSLAVIADAIVHGMPVTPEVADLRNEICRVIRDGGEKVV